jgi:hypothetical protein
MGVECMKAASVPESKRGVNVAPPRVFKREWLAFENGSHIRCFPCLSAKPKNLLPRIPPMPAVVAVSALLRGRRELFIAHGQARYRLSLTK